MERGAERSASPGVSVAIEWAVIEREWMDEDAVTLPVDLPALFVKYIVVFKQVFANIKVRAFNTVLGIFNDVADETNFQWKRIIHFQCLHEPIDAVAAKQAHERAAAREHIRERRDHLQDRRHRTPRQP